VTSALAALALLFGELSVLAVGGVNTVLPEMPASGGAGPRLDEACRIRGSVRALAGSTWTEHARLDADRLARCRTARRAGRHSVAVRPLEPADLSASRTWHAFRHAPWRGIVQHGLVPVTVGLVMAAAVLLAEATSASWAKAAVTAATTAVLVASRVHPLLLLATGAAFGAAGLLG
jgi:chromate transporter